MILIIEGPDLSGKTYAIEKIAKYFNSGFILKNTYKPKTAEDSKKLLFHYWDILTLVSERGDLIILDRFFPSQAVYSYLRGVDEMKSDHILILDKYAEETKILYLYLDTPLDLLLERYDKRGDEHIKKDMLITLKERYDEFFEQTNMIKERVNTMEKNWLEKVEAFINANGGEGFAQTQFH